MCGVCVKGIGTGCCCCIRNILWIAITIGASISSSHFYMKLRVHPTPKSIPYFKGPVHFQGVSIGGINGTCQDSPILWKGLTSKYTQVSGKLSWRHGHPMTAIVIADNNVNGTSIVVRTDHYEKHFEAIQGKFQSDIRVSQNSSLHVKVKSHGTHAWNLTLIA